MTEYMTFREHYIHCSTTDSGLVVSSELLIAQSNFEEIVNLFEGSTTREIHPTLFIEYRRIFTLVLRRFSETIESRRNGLVYSMIDQARALFELMLQAFCLIRSSNALEIALDAYNLSAMSWYSKRNTLLISGELEFDPENKWIKNKAQVEAIFAKYKKRRPKFFADMTVKKVSEIAKLERQYEIFYGLLSSITHNESFSSEDQALYVNGELEINVIPKRINVKRIAAFFSYANEIFLITSLACLGNFLIVDRPKYEKIASDIRGSFNNDFWGKEIDYLEQLAKEIIN